MKRSFVTVAVLITACSARGAFNTPPTDLDVVPFGDALITPDVPTFDRSMTVDEPVVIVEDNPVVDTPPPPPDKGSGGCSRDTDCEGATWCEAATRMCRPIVCTPGRTQCLSAMRARVCDARGSMATETDCPGGCANGVCAGGMTGCTAPLTQCGAMCVDIAIDTANCGRCGNACTAGQSCVGGTCVAMPVCSAPQMLCGGTCVDVRTNTTHCGRCNNACAVGRACSAGVCTTTTMCTLPEIDCGGVCVDTQTSTTNCGLCGRTCTAGQACRAGVCSTTTTNVNYTRIDPPASVTFIDACAAPGAMRVLAGSDDQSTTTPLPFVFPFWGVPITAGRPVGISSNGFISLDGFGYAATSGMIPSSSVPNGVIAAYWRNLVTSSSPGICIATVGAAPSRRFVVEWAAARHFSSASVAITTEIVLNESDGSIDLLTQSVGASVSSATVGVEDLTGTRAVSGCAATNASCIPVTGGRVRFAPVP